MSKTFYMDVPRSFLLHYVLAGYWLANSYIHIFFNSSTEMTVQYYITMAEILGSRIDIQNTDKIGEQFLHSTKKPLLFV